MQVIRAYNIRDALPKAVRLVLEEGVVEETRLGQVVCLAEPVAIHYHYPKQHVLLNPIRDANPFFHLMESCWMLAGRQDAAFLEYYVKGFAEKYSNNGIVMDAYGFRWKWMFHTDQLREIINQLKKTPTTRQAVLQMWHTEDLKTTSAKPCNLIVTFRILGDALDMTVFNRSNDLIWGCCGSNAVHFPILQEYIAGKVGVKVGEYWQISTNLHFYKEHDEMLWNRIGRELQPRYELPWYLADTSGAYGPTMPLMEVPEQFDADLELTMLWIDEMQSGGEDIDTTVMVNSFLRDTVIPMARAHHFYKKKCYTYALEEIQSVAAEDWRRAGNEWIRRRSPKDTTVMIEETTDAS